MSEVGKEKISKIKRDRPYLIGVSGASGSGKTSISNILFNYLGIENCLLFSMDTYYKNLTPEQEKNLNDYNFDSPEALDLDLLSEHISSLMNWKSIEMPTYDFVTNSRQEKTIEVKPNKFIVFEGILSFYDERIRNLMDLKIFVDVDEDICLSRRIFRDVTARGRQLESVIERYHKFVKPAYNNFIKPTKRFADIIIPRGTSNSIVIELLNYHLLYKLSELYPEKNEELKKQESENPNNILKKDKVLGLSLSSSFSKQLLSIIQAEEIFDEKFTIVRDDEKSSFKEMFAHILTGKKYCFYGLYMDIFTKTLYQLIKGKILIFPSFGKEKINDIIKEKEKSNSSLEIILYVPILIEKEEKVQHILEQLISINSILKIYIISVFLVGNIIDKKYADNNKIVFKSIYYGDALLKYKKIILNGGYLTKACNEYSNKFMSFSTGDFEFNLAKFIEKK